MKLTTYDLEKLTKPARALLAKLVGCQAATLFLEDAEGREVVLHARHRGPKVLIKAWSGTVGYRVVDLARPFANERFISLAVRCLAAVTAETEREYRARHAGELRARACAESRLEEAMRARLARRDERRDRERAERARKPRFFERLLRYVHLL